MIKNKKILIITLTLYLFLAFNFMMYEVKAEYYEISSLKIPFSSQSETLDELEIRTGWGGNKNDKSCAIACDSADNVYIAGGTESYGEGSNDLFIVKYNSKGEKQWEIIWGGSEHDGGLGITCDSSNNIYITGSTLSYGPNSFGTFLLKYNEDGEKQWQKTWYYPYEFGKAITCDSSDNIILLANGRGSTYSRDVFIVKFNSAGDLLWEKQWGVSGEDLGFDITCDYTDNIFITGRSAGDMFLAKYNNVGVKLWDRSWGTTSKNEEGMGIECDSSGNVYVTGVEGSWNMYLIKYNSAGNIQWEKTWGGSDHDEGYRIECDSSNNIYVAGNSRHFSPYGENVFCLKYNSAGDQLWNVRWNDNNEGSTWGFASDSADNYYITGWVNSSINENYNAFIIVIDKDGEQQFNDSWNDLFIEDTGSSNNNGNNSNGNPPNIIIIILIILVLIFLILIALLNILIF